MSILRAKNPSHTASHGQACPYYVLLLMQDRNPQALARWNGSEIERLEIKFKENAAGFVLCLLSRHER